MTYIPTTELKRGIEFCDRNAKSMLEAARTLFEKRYFGYSLGLAILSMEEYAKKLVLSARSLHPDKFEREVTNAFRDHKLKLQLALYMLMKEYPDIPPENEIPKIVGDLGNKLEGLRLRGFYVDFWKEKGRRLCPQDEELRSVAKMQIRYLTEFFKRVDSWLTRIMETKKQTKGVGCKKGRLSKFWFNTILCTRVCVSRKKTCQSFNSKIRQRLFYFSNLFTL